MTTTITGRRVVEHRVVDGHYGLLCEQMIIEYPHIGRVLLSQVYGGENTPRGGGYRWGVAVKLQPEDTFRSLAVEEWNEDASLFDAVLLGIDNTRPMQAWGNAVVEAVAHRFLRLTPACKLDTDRLVADLVERFPGLAGRDDAPINGGDLVDWLATRLQQG